MNADYNDLRRLGKTLDGGVFFNSDGSIVFHAFHNRHLLFLLLPVAFIPVAWQYSWWLLLGTPVSLVWFIRWIIKRKAVTGLRMDFDAKELRRGGVRAPFASLEPQSFVAVHEKDVSHIHCVHPRLEMQLPLNFHDVDFGKDAPDGFGFGHEERAETFVRLLNSCVSEGAKSRKTWKADKANVPKTRTAAQRKDSARSLSQDQTWMLRPADILAHVYGLQPSGLLITPKEGDTHETLRELLKERWAVETPQEALQCFGRCSQGLRGLLAAIQPLALLPRAAQKAYLDYLEEAAAELQEEAKTAASKGLPAALASFPGEAFSRVLPLLYEKNGIALISGYAEATRKAHEAGELPLLLEAEEALCLQARLKGQISFVAVESRLSESAGAERFHTAVDAFAAMLAELGATPAEQAECLLQLQNLKTVRSGLIHNEDYLELESGRLKILANPDSAILLDRNPYIAWDYARAAFIRRVMYTLGWEEHVEDIWTDLRPMAKVLQKSFTDWPELLPVIRKAQLMEGSDREFGTPEEFDMALKSKAVERAAAPEKLPWRMRLDGKK